MLLLDDRAPIHWAIAGATIGLITLLLQFLFNRSLGVSTGFENLCAVVSKRPYFTRPEVKAGSWRLWMLAGLVTGGVLSAALSGGPAPAWDLGPRFEAAFGSAEATKALWMLAGGTFIGFGTRLAGGCTSGHGIFGISNFERSSFVATLSFMAAGVVTTNLLYRVIAG